MKNALVVLAIATLLASCQARETGDTTQNGSDQVPVVAPSAGEAVAEQPAAPTESQPVVPPVEGAFQSPLPQGVVISVPHYARMDVSTPGKNGASGRRTEFEYLEGDAAQAMRSFADSMSVAGFTSEEGASSDEGVVRQSFRKDGYGAVFARAQELPPSRKVNESARGFLVVAWPARGGSEPAQKAGGADMPAPAQQ